MSTFLDLATDALTELGTLGVGEVMSADDAYLCLREMNRLTQEWSIDRVNLFTVGSSTLVLAAAKQSYQIGTGAVDFPNNPRPLLIQTARVIIPGTTAGLPLALIGAPQFAALTEKGLSGAFPDKLYDDYNSPISTFYVHPIPNQVVSIEIYAWALLQQIVNITDVLNFPAGYENALKFNLAVKLANSFGLPLGQTTAMQAASGKAAIQKINTQVYAGPLGSAVSLQMPTEGEPTGPPSGAPPPPPQ